MKVFKCVVTLALLMSSLAYAGPGQVGSATEPNAFVSDFDVLMSNKHELEVRLSKDAADYASYKALVENTLARLNHVSRRFQYGLVTQEAVALVQAEVVGLNSSCPVLLQNAQRLFNVGLKTRAQVETVTSACEMLQGR